MSSTSRWRTWSAASPASSCGASASRSPPGEAYGLVGESGCGKSTTAFAALRYLPANGRIVGGHVKVAGDDVTEMNDAELRSFRSHHASMVYQDPGSALNPTLRVGPQVIECFTLLGHKGEQAERRAEEALRMVRIADPGVRDGALPVPALGRHAAARRHRHGPGLRSAAPRARRADHRPRRHGRGRGARPGQDPPSRDVGRDPAHRPQPGRDPLDVRPRRRDVRREAGRGRAGAGGVRRPEAPLHRGAAALPAPPRPAQGRAGAVHHPGHAAPDRCRSAGLRLRASAAPSRRTSAAPSRRPAWR